MTPIRSTRIVFHVRRISIVLFLTVLFGFLDGPLEARAAESPNVVFLFADDLGWTDLGCYGSAYYETPNIDRLRSEGMKFTSAYTNGPNCQPTRACLLSGQYSPRHGVYTVRSGDRGLEKFRRMIPAPNRTYLPAEVVTIAEAAKTAGYATGCFGKWHLGEKPKHLPRAQGFDEVASRGKHAAHPATEHLTDRTIDFIRRYKERPFFAYVPFHAVHTPIRAGKERADRFNKKPRVGGHNDAVYAAMLSELDDGVGRILRTLDELDLRDNTLVVFYSDNGALGGYNRAGIYGGIGKDISDNAPLHGGKGMLYEGGIRVPLIVRWPSTVSPGSLCHEPVISVDFYPTLLQVMRAETPSQPLDGLSLLPLLRAPQSAHMDRDALFWHFPGYLQAGIERGSWRTTPAGAIRVGNFKLIEFFETGRVELYDLANNISETENLAADKPAVAERLHRTLIAWRERMNAPMPKPK